MNKFVVDASAWIEYFNGSKVGGKIKKIIENKENSIYTNIITISEISSFFERRKYNFEDAKNTILSLSYIYNIDIQFGAEAGMLHANLKKERKNISLADIFILLTAKKLNAKIITLDEDFHGLKEIYLID